MALKFHGLHALMPSSIEKNAAAAKETPANLTRPKHWLVAFSPLEYRWFRRGFQDCDLMPMSIDGFRNLRSSNFTDTITLENIWLKQGSPNKKATKFGDIQVTWRNFPGNFRNLLPLVGSAFFFSSLVGFFWERSWISWRWASPWTSNPKVYFGRTFASLRGVKWFSWVLGVWTFVFLVWCQIQFLKLGANQLTFGND